MSDYTHVLALDPGGTTGWSYGVYSDTTALEFVDGGQIKNGVDGFVEWWKIDRVVARLEPDTVVSESFQLRPGVKNPNVMPLRIEGALAVFRGPQGVTWQQPVAKVMVPDHKLRENGLWIPGERHHMDARIHALAHMVNRTHRPTLEAYWPR